MPNPVIQTLTVTILTCVFFLSVVFVLKNYVWIQSSHVWDDFDIYQFTIWGYFCIYFHVAQAMHIGHFGWFWCTLAAAQVETEGLEIMVPFINDHCFQLRGLVTLKPHPSVLYRDVIYVKLGSWICSLSTCQWSRGSSTWYQTHEHTSHELSNDNMIWSYSFWTHPNQSNRAYVECSDSGCGFPANMRSLLSTRFPGVLFSLHQSLCRNWLATAPPNSVCGVNGCVMGGSWCMIFEDTWSLQSTHVNLNIFYRLQVSWNNIIISNIR